jgi:hypothetical protein
VYGHQQRQAIAARRMTRGEWRALTGDLRRQRWTPRGRQLLTELVLATGCDCSESISAGPRDVLTDRMYGTGAWARPGEPRAARDPRDCLGIPGVLRVQLALHWHPTQRHEVQ